jgi:thiol-disulfide isomerase/thioredoxin
MDGAPPIRSRRGEFVRTVVLALVVTAVVVAVFLVLRPKSPAPPPPAKPTAADLAAPKSLQRAAAAIGFTPRTEPGVGSIEYKGANAAKPPSNPDLLAVGTIPPSFSLKTPEGQTVTLASLRGKVALLEFFATWCPHCVAEAPHLAAMAREFGHSPVQFVSINADSEDAASVYAYHRYFGLPFPALLDPGGSPAGSFHHGGGLGPTARAYHLGYYPTFYVLDKHGVIRWHGDVEQPDATLRQAIDRALAQPS